MIQARSPLPGQAALASAAALLAAGCASTSLSGLSGSSSYACKAPAGVQCESVAGTYANALQNNLPSQRPQVVPPPAAVMSNPPGPITPTPTPLLSPAAQQVSNSPLRTSTRILRLWFKPWEDADGDLCDQGYVYVQIDSGQWLIDHAHRQVRESAVAPRPPALPPRKAASAETRKDPAATPRQADPQAPLPASLLPRSLTEALRSRATPADAPRDDD